MDLVNIMIRIAVSNKILISIFSLIPADADIEFFCLSVLSNTCIDSHHV